LHNLPVFRYDTLDVFLFELLAAHGFNTQEVHEPGTPSPPLSPRPFTEEQPVPDLFPEQRVVVLQITLAQI
jgi:hypothetical protein